MLETVSTGVVYTNRAHDQRDRIASALGQILMQRAAEIAHTQGQGEVTDLHIMNAADQFGLNQLIRDNSL